MPKKHITMFREVNGVKIRSVYFIQWVTAIETATPPLRGTTVYLGDGRVINIEDKTLDEFIETYFPEL